MARRCCLGLKILLMAPKLWSVGLLLVGISLLSQLLIGDADAFVLRRSSNQCQSIAVGASTSKLAVSKLREGPKSPLPANSDDDNNNDDDDDILIDDAALLRQINKEQLADLCRQFNLSTNGTKEELLVRLRAYAQDHIQREKERLINHKKHVEEGSDDDRVKYEIVDDGEYDDDDDDDDSVFVYVSSNVTVPEGFETEQQREEREREERRREGKQMGPMTRQSLTAPPPPPVEPNENGERVVTVYSTSDQNDLTGVAAAQPGLAAMPDPMTGAVTDPEDAPWDLKKNEQSATTSAQWEAAKEEVIDLVSGLLSMTGAPYFQNDDSRDDDDDDEDEDDVESEPDDSPFGVVRKRRRSFLPSSFTTPEGFVGFDPSNVPIDLLTKASKSLRMGRGKVLQEVAREFELRAVGYDGAAGDDKDRGGGHYRQVSMVRSFLEGYRRAEVRRLARETTTMLLEKLVSDGIEGLDEMLSGMTRSGDDTSDEAGELNDSLLDYLNDAIRQQEKKVDQLVDSAKKVSALERAMVDEDSEDNLQKLWRVEEEGGVRVESLDPSDPKTKQALLEEYERGLMTQRPRLPPSVPEKLLLLLTLLRDRVKIEATFSHDEKSKNLRVLAYCLKLQTDKLRKELIVKEFGYSLDVSAVLQHLEFAGPCTENSCFGPNFCFCSTSFLVIEMTAPRFVRRTSLKLNRVW